MIKYLMAFLSTVFIAPNLLSSQVLPDPIIREAERLKWGDLAKSVATLTQGLAEATDPMHQAQFCLALSQCYNQRRNHDSIQYWNLRAESLFNQIGDERGKAEVLYQKGYAAFAKMEYQQALEHILNGLTIMETLKDNAGIALGYLRISRIFHFTSKMKQSAEYGHRAAPLFEKLGDHANAWDSWSFAGHGYRMTLDTINALICFNNGMTQARLSEIPEIEGMAFNDLASFFNEVDNYDSAVVYFEKALTYVDPSDDRQLMVTKNGLGQSYLHSGRYQECIDLLMGAMETVAKTDDLFFLTEIPEYIALSYAGLGQFDSAYKYMELNWRSTDQFFQESQDKALEEMRTKYETDRKDALIAQQQLERRYGFALLAGAGILAFMFYLRYANKKKNNELLNQKNKEKDFLLREIHHRVKNNLQILSSLLNLQSDYIKDENAQHAITEGRNRVQSMAFIHQQLYSEDNMTAVDMQAYLADICDHLTDSFSDSHKEIHIQSDIQIGSVDVETAIPLGLIVNELITNSIKYAFTGKTEGNIQVKLWESDNHKLCLKVSDNGHGKVETESQEHNRSFGTDLIHILSKKLKGEVEIDTEHGYSTLIQFSRYEFSAGT